MVGVLSSIAADAGYLVLVPLAAAAFHSIGRHPLAGLAAGFSGVAAVFLVNVFVTPTDALLVEVTNDAIRAVNPDAQINVVGNLYFMIVSSIVMGLICTHHHRQADRAPPRRPTPAASRSRRRRPVGQRAAGAEIRRPRVSRLRRRARAPDCAADPLGHPAQPGDRRHHGGLAVHERPDHPDQPAVPRRRLRLRARRGDHRQRHRRDRHDRQDLDESRRDDLPPVRHRQLHRLLQLHQPRDGAGGEPRGLPADGADRRHRLYHPVRARRRDHRHHPDRRAGEMGDPRAGVRAAVHAARRRSEPGARRVPRRRQPDERDHPAERLSRGDGRLRAEIPEGRRASARSSR